MGLTNFPNGVTSFGVPVLPSIGQLQSTGNVFFVDAGADNASDGNVGSKEKPLATIEAAMDKCTANNGDIVFVMPGHTETISATTSFDVAGVAFVGMGWGRSKPAITLSAAEAIDIDGANQVWHNLRFIASAAGAFNVAAADVVISQCRYEHGAVTIGMTMASGADRFWVDGCDFVGTAANPDVAIDLEAHLADWKITNCVFNYVGSAGLDLAGIRSNVDAQEGGLIHGCQFIAMDLTAVDINSSVSAQGDGMISRCEVVAGAAVATIDLIVDLGGFSAVDVLATDNPAASGVEVPATTAA